MIHVMNFKGEIVDFIAQSDSAVIQAVHKRDINERIETFDFTILSERTTYMQERNRIVIQDKNGQYREFIIDRISADIEGYTEVETVASYLEDITKARPYAPGKLEKMTTKQALSDVLKDTGWQVSDATEYDGLRTTSWTSYQTRYDVLLQLCTTYKMMADFYIEVGSNRVDKRLVVLRKRNPLFKGKEITYGKDLTGLKRTVDFSEIKTALLCVGPEPEEGKKRVELVVKDDESQAKYGLPGRYNWGIYEPETEDQNMTEKRLRTLGTTELNKRKSEVITYEVTAIDIEKEYKHEIVNLGDMVRIKNRDFTPPLYVEAEVISEEYDLISKDVTYGFGTYKEFKESDLRSSFDRKLDAIRQKVSDGLSNVNTIVRESLEGELQYFERKISKGDTPPDNPVNDLLWLDTSNPEVAVLRRYWNGEWIKSSAENADDVGAITREQALYSELNNTFVNLTIHHSRLIHEVSDVLESEYLVDTDIKEEVNSKLNETIGVFNTIKSNLDSMTSETATIGKLVDTQALFLEYREKLQALYNAVENAKIAIDQRFKLLQSQYTDEKFNEALNNVASKLGLTVNEDNQLVGEVDVSKQINESVREMTNEMLRDYVTSTEYQSDKNGIIERLNSADTERQQLSNEISDRVTLSEYNSGIDSTKQYADEQVNNLTLGNVNLIKSYHSPEYLKTATVEDDYSLLFSTSGKNINFFFYDSNGYTNAPLEANTDYILKLHEADENVEMGVFYNKGRNTIKTYTKDRVIRFNTADKVDFRILLIARDANVHAGKLSLYKGTKELDWTPNPEDVNAKIDQAKAGAEKSSKAYTDNKVQQVNQTLSTHETRLTQNGKDIALRATQEELNASKKTLSRVIADLTVNTTTGLTMTYDENGAIQSHTIGPDGIKLKGDRVNITVNKDFNVLVNDVANKADETNIINKINLSREGLDINVNNIGIRGGSGTSYVDIRNDLIELSGEYTRTFRGDTQKDYVYTRMKDGLLRFRNNTRNRSLYYSDFGISTYVDGGPNESSGTLQFFDYTYSKNARGVTLNSVTGVVALRSDNNSIVIESSLTTNIESNNYSVYIRPFKQSRAGLNEFQFYVKDADSSSNTDGCILFGNLTDPNGVHGSGIRFSKSRTDNILYVTNPNGDIGTGDISVRAAEIRDYIRTIGMLEIRQWSDSKAFNQIKVGAVNTTNSVVMASHSGGNAYYGVGGGSNEMRVTNNNGYNGGNTSYKPVRASAFNNASLAEYKKDIKVWDYDALSVIANDLELYQYRYKGDSDDQMFHRGVVIGDGYLTPAEFVFGDGVNLYEMLTWSLRSIQQLNEKINKLEEQLNEQTAS
ncbi:phage tail spike protein [Staphylococcus pseudintermedius]|uniref:phage tail spike protein n=1 Tax=Staphylococcus pseudintermedius TaxID=283734 RepID=UPI0025536948|nr:phage tail spike protein [Staphylococcus pseudintermedius]MDK9612931.1 phage tail spike protein [Staphylococcus pseudintermedius]MDT0950354.1 phage tail spike protein [Staphylococcus pseudintermedius]